jgi:hypothetical protein
MHKRITAAVTGVVATVLGTEVALAEDVGTDVASAGNGGVATASANGGAISVGNINSGGNACNAIGIGNTYAAYPVDPAVYGGDCVNSTALGIAANGGTAIADASGGSYNLAFVS